MKQCKGFMKMIVLARVHELSQPSTRNNPVRFNGMGRLLMMVLVIAVMGVMFFIRWPTWPVFVPSTETTVKGSVHLPDACTSLLLLNSNQKNVCSVPVLYYCVCTLYEKERLRKTDMPTRLSNVHPFVDLLFFSKNIV